MKIVSNPEYVCVDHALEYWTGLVSYARETADTCVKEEGFCTCRSCQETSAAYLRAAAIAAAGPSPLDHEHFAIGLAS